MKILGIKLPKIKLPVLFQETRKDLELKKAKVNFHAEVEKSGMAKALAKWKVETDAIKEKYGK